MLKYKVSFLLVLCMILLSCIHTPKSDEYIKENFNRVSYKIEGVPFFPQESNQCGSAVLATLLNYWSIQTLPAQLQPLLFIPEKEGTLALEIKALSRSYDLIPYELNPNFSHLVSEIEANHPVIVLQNLGLDMFPRWHFSVVIGNDARNHKLLMRSGATKGLQTAYKTFETTWKRANYWAVVLLPAGRLPASLGPREVFLANYELESLGKKELAKAGYLAGQEKWPQNTIFPLALGNLAYFEGDYHRAETYFKKVVTMDQDNGDGWNNLANSLLARREFNKASRAIARALEIDPENKDYSDTKRAIVIDRSKF